MLLKSFTAKKHCSVRLSDRAARDELSVADLSTSTFGIVDTGIAGSMLGTGIMCGAWPEILSLILLVVDTLISLMFFFFVF